MRIECKSTGEVVYSYQAYLKTEHWRFKKDELKLLTDTPQCTLCRCKEKLSVHHRTYKRIGNEQPRDLLHLCQPCHTALHGVMDRMKISGAFEIRNEWTELFSTMKKVSKVAKADVLEKEKDSYYKRKVIVRKRQANI